MAKPQAPPNLRFSTSDRDCSNCIAFKANSQTCGMFNDYLVSPEMVCDDWQADDPDAVKTNGNES